ncbi:MAG: hypothetical protein BGO54_06525 [Sphingobacteriales bacterium 46-32]|nr:MAG: hypothetical protein BGO54_06525 [Sphingobacteriales bacterium 46-32]
MGPAPISPPSREVPATRLSIVGKSIAVQSGIIIFILLFRVTLLTGLILLETEKPYVFYMIKYIQYL